MLFKIKAFINKQTIVYNLFNLPFPRTATRFLHHNIVPLGLSFGIWVIFITIIIIRQILRQFPELFCPKTIVWSIFGLVPKDLVSYFIRLRIVVQNKRAIILGCLVHYRTKRFQRREHRRKILPNLLAIC